MAYYLKLSSMALSGCKPKLFCNTARIASAVCSVKSTKYIRSNAASLNAADKKRRKCTLIPEDGVGPELVHSVLEVYKGVIDSFETVTAKKSFAFDYAIKNNRKKVTAVHKAFIMSHRFYSNSANEPDESSEPKIQVDGMILDHTKNSKQSQLCEVKNVVNNLYCYLNVRLLHMRSTLQAFNGQMTVDFEEKLKLNELPCSVKEKLESARKLYVNDMSYQAGFAQAEAVLLPELEARDKKLSNEIETKREILLRRTVRQEIEAIELEFKKLRFLVESLNTNSEALTEWQKHNTDIPALFVMPPYLKLRFNENILDIIQSRREERLYWYLENPPKVQTSFMRHFFAFKEKLDARNHDYRLAATSFGFLYRIISNPYHEESDILLDKYPKDDRISRTIHHNIIAEVLLDGLDIQPADKK